MAPWTLDLGSTSTWTFDLGSTGIWPCLVGDIFLGNDTVAFRCYLVINVQS